MGEIPDQLKEFAWKPGESGNPAGRPKRPTFESLVAGILDQVVPGTDTTKREALAMIFVDLMLQRNSRIIKEFLAREWAVVSKHEFEGNIRGEIAVTSDLAWDAFARALPSVTNGAQASRGNGRNGSGKPSNGPE